MHDARARRETRLAQIAALLAAGENALELRFERAQLLDELGQTDAARSGYLDVLTRDSTHVGALTDLGRLLDRTGFHAAARSAYARAVDTHPEDAASHGNLASALLDDGDVEAAREHYEIAIRLDPANLAAHQCLAILHLREGNAAAAAAHGRIGFRAGASAWPYRGPGEPIRVLALHSALGGNVSIERFIDDATFAKWTIVAEFADPDMPLPAHDFVLNAIGDAERCRAGLRAAQALLARTTAPVINGPGAVRATGRAVNARRLARLAGVVAPRVRTRSRAQLTAPDAAASLAAAGLGAPVIVRAPGFQTGKHCVLVERPEQLAEAVSTLPGDPLLVMQFVDVRAGDGNFRKYRVMIVGGEIFPLHLAISRRWMVHYYTADMADEPSHRAEEAAFLADMGAVLGPAVIATLESIARRLRLDYGGIDFALDAAGQVVVFEANATMIVPLPPADGRWAYRRAPVGRIDAAVRKLLLARAGMLTEREADSPVAAARP